MHPTIESIIIALLIITIFISFYIRLLVVQDIIQNP